jgi:hypothetical protein
MAIWYLKWFFGNLVVFWYNFSRLGTLYHEKIWQPWPVTYPYNVEQ